MKNWRLKEKTYKKQLDWFLTLGGIILGMAVVLGICNWYSKKYETVDEQEIFPEETKVSFFKTALGSILVLTFMMAVKRVYLNTSRDHRASYRIEQLSREEFES